MSFAMQRRGIIECNSLAALAFLLLLRIGMTSSLATTTHTATRTILITGATDGIGKHTAQKLASDGNHLLVHGRQPKLGVQLEQDLRNRGASSVRYFNSDLADLVQVEQLANQVLHATTKDGDNIYPKLDVLINNAGVFDPPSPAKSAQGYDQTWAVNVMAPFLLTRRLLPLLAASEDPCPRIITTSSISQSYELPNLEELFDKSTHPKSAHRAYSDSKLGDLMFTVHLSKLLNEYPRLQKIKCLTMDPGTVNTKMLIAGWGACGINVHQANNTYKLATAYGAEQNVKSGSYHFGGGGSRDAQNSDKLQALFTKLEECTGCTYSDIGSI